MDIRSYHQYLKLMCAGRKADAKATLGKFLDSFETAEEVSAWVAAFLKGGGFGFHIRHEIYERLVFPVLLEGYARKDAEATLWLAKTVSNLYRCPALHAQVGFKGEFQFLDEAYALKPRDAIRLRLLECNLKWFDYCQHEWPAGILYGIDGADSSECEEILQAIARSRDLDDGTHQAYLDSFEAKVWEYLARLAGSAA